MFVYAIFVHFVYKTCVCSLHGKLGKADLRPCLNTETNCEDPIVAAA